MPRAGWPQMLDRNIVALHMRAWPIEKIMEVTRAPRERIERAIGTEGLQPSDRARPQAATNALLMEVLEAYYPDLAPIQVIKSHLFPGEGHLAWRTSVRLTVKNLRRAGHNIVNHNDRGYRLVRGES